MLLLFPGLLLLALLLVFFLPRIRQRKAEDRPATNITATSPWCRAFKLLLAPLLITKDGVVWCLGLLTGSNGKSEAEIRALAGHAREALDKALGKDDPLEARRALERLVRLKEGRREGGMPLWLGEAVGPLKEERVEVEEREEHRLQVVRELGEAIGRCEETLMKITGQVEEEEEEEGLSHSSPSYPSSSSSSSAVVVIHRRTASASYSSSSSSFSSSSSSALLWAGTDDQELRLVAALERAKETLATAAAAIAAVAPAVAAAAAAAEDGTSPTLSSLVQRGERILSVWQRGRDGAAEVELARHHSHAMNPPPPPSMPAAAAAGGGGGGEGGGGGGGRHAYSSISSSSGHSRNSSFVVVKKVGEGGREEGEEGNDVLFPSIVDETNASVGETETGAPRGVMVDEEKEEEEEGKEEGVVGGTETVGRSPEGGGRGSQEDRRSTNSSSSSSSSSSSGAMVVSSGRELTTTTTIVSAEGGRMVVHDLQQQQQQQQALIMGAFTQSVQQELRRQTTAARVIQLEEMLEKRRQYRARQRREEGRVAKLEQTRRKENLRQRGRELVEARRRHEMECGEVDETRRQRDQALFTYLLPVSLAVFCVVVYLASLSEESHGGGSGGMLLVDALWHVPFHDLLYGNCKARLSSLPSLSSSSSSPPMIKVVHHNVKRIPGAARPPSSSSSSSGGLQLLSWMVSYVVPEGVDLGLTGAFEMTGCYVKRTVALLVNTGVMVLLHYLMGGLGLRQHRAKLHVGLLLYCCREAFARLTWRSLLSIRCVLGFHGLLWMMTAWKDEGHAFTHRHVLFHRVVPVLAVGVGVWDAARQVDPVVAWESFKILAERIVNSL